MRVTEILFVKSVEFDFEVPVVDIFSDNYVDHWYIVEI